MLRVMENARRKQIAWLRAILDETGWNQSELARRAGISHAAISKFLKDSDNAAELATATVGKIHAISPIPHYENVRGAMPAGFDEREAEPFDGDMDNDAAISRAVAAIKGGSNHVEPWVLRTDAIENAGYRSGDILFVDFSAQPKPGDVVCAQIYDNQGGAETAFRLYHKPFLVASSNSPRHLAPTLIDQRVDVRGVVIASLRPRLSRLAS
jgi:transcriptional regulator with XRE-family HTH domain